MTSITSVGEYKLGDLIIEGKTKQVYDLPSLQGHCILLNKDRITAGDGVKAHNLVGKAAISNQTNGKVFGILNAAGIKTAYVKSASDNAFISTKCQMIPIEWVTRRLATGSFLKRNVGVPEGYRFAPPKHETFFKDDANHDPQWSDEQIVSASFVFNGLKIDAFCQLMPRGIFYYCSDTFSRANSTQEIIFTLRTNKIGLYFMKENILGDVTNEEEAKGNATVGQTEIDIMRDVSILVFEVLEKAWATRNCALIDMKIEFGVQENGELVVADVIDSDSWRLWPSGDKRLMKDKQVYRNLATVVEADLETIKNNFIWISEQLDHIVVKSEHMVVILMGSPSDKDHCAKIARYCADFGLNVQTRITSAHKGTLDTIKIVRKYESEFNKLVFVAVAGRSNGLGPVLSGNTTYPVINCPPVKQENINLDIWSSLNIPSGLGCSTVIYPEAAAIQAAQIIGLGDFMVWSKLRVKQLNNLNSLRHADKYFNA